MRNPRSIVTAGCIVVALLAASVAWAQSAPVLDNPPLRFNPRSLDGGLVSVYNPVDGRTWSAWAYRNGAEYDIAISHHDESGVWSEPEFLGRYDRRDQVQPALAVDPFGTVYLAYVDRSDGSVNVTGRVLGAAGWLESIRATLDGERGDMPELSIVGDRLVVAFRSGRILVIRDFPLLIPPPPPLTGTGVQEGPDPFGKRDGDPRNGGGGSGSGGSGGGNSGTSGPVWPTRDSR